MAYSVGSAWIETSARNNENVGEAHLVCHYAQGLTTLICLAQVFEMCLNEIEKARRGTATPQPSKCFLM